MKFKMGKKKYKYLYINIYTARSQMSEKEIIPAICDLVVYIFVKKMRFLFPLEVFKNDINYKKVSSTRKKRN